MVVLVRITYLNVTPKLQGVHFLAAPKIHIHETIHFKQSNRSNLCESKAT